MYGQWEQSQMDTEHLPFDDESKCSVLHETDFVHEKTV